jgi:purine-nucleoside phosphorylase
MLNELRKQEVVSIDMELSVYLSMLGSAGKSSIGIIVIDDRPLENDYYMSAARKEKNKIQGGLIQYAILESILEVLDLVPNQNNKGTPN